MLKSKVIRLLVIAGFLISCNTKLNSELTQKINGVKDGQQLIIKRIVSLEKSINTLALANKNEPAVKKTRRLLVE